MNVTFVEIWANLTFEFVTCIQDATVLFLSIFLKMVIVCFCECYEIKALKVNAVVMTFFFVNFLTYFKRSEQAPPRPPLPFDGAPMRPPPPPETDDEDEVFKTAPLPSQPIMVGLLFIKNVQYRNKIYLGCRT